MGRYDHLKKISELNSDVVSFHEKGLNTKKRLSDVEKEYGRVLKLISFKFDSFMCNIISDSNYAYSMASFFKHVDPLSARFNDFRIIMRDMYYLIDKKKLNEFSELSYSYFLINLYASHFDSIINFLESICKEIQKTKCYNIVSAGGRKYTKINNAESTLLLLSKYDSTFYNKVRKFMNRDFRNAIAHENYMIESKMIFYNLTKTKRNRIKQETIFKMLISIGSLVNEIYQFQSKNMLIINNCILENKFTKKQIRRYLKIYNPI